MKYIKIFEEFDRDNYQSHWIKFCNFMDEHNITIDETKFEIVFSNVANDDSLSSDEKAVELTQHIENDYGFNDQINWSDMVDYLERLFMDEV